MAKLVLVTPEGLIVSDKQYHLKLRKTKKIFRTMIAAREC